MLGGRALLVPIAAAQALACAPGVAPEPSYDPARSLLEIVAVLRLHVPDDTYRFEPARDFDPQNPVERVVTAMKGTIFVDAADMQVMRTEAQTVAPIKWGAGLISLRRAWVHWEARKVNGEVWLPAVNCTGFYEFAGDTCECDFFLDAAKPPTAVRMLLAAAGKVVLQYSELRATYQGDEFLLWQSVSGLGDLRELRSQVAAAAGAQLRVAKQSGSDKTSRTEVVRLDADERREEIARMLAGAEVTDEARAAADRLMRGEHDAPARTDA